MRKIIYAGTRIVHQFDLVDIDTGKKIGDSFMAEDAARDGSLEEYAVVQQRFTTTWQQLKTANEGAGGEPASPPAQPPTQPPAPEAPAEEKNPKK